MTWTNECVYLFPPFSILGQNRERPGGSSSCSTIVANTDVVSKVIDIYSGTVIHSPSSDGHLDNADPLRQHPFRKMRLGCFRLSEKPLQAENYRKTLLKLSSLPGDHQLRSNIGRTSKDGCCFVTHERLIQSYHL